MLIPRIFINLSYLKRKKQPQDEVSSLSSWEVVYTCTFYANRIELQREGHGFLECSAMCYSASSSVPKLTDKPLSTSGIGGGGRRGRGKVKGSRPKTQR